MQNLTPNVFVETEYFPTVSFVVTPEGVVAIDSPQNPPENAAWRAVMEAKGPIRYLINTEYHLDHTMGNGFMPGPIVSSAYNRAHFLDSAGSNEKIRGIIRQRSPESAAEADAYELRMPEITFRDRMTLRLGGTTFRLLRWPGHSPGQVVVHVPEERVAMVADNVVNGAPPFLHEADLWGWFESLARIESLDVDWYVPGHGAPFRKDWIPRFRELLYGLVGEVRAARDRGLSREEAQREIRYMDRPGFSYPAYMAERLKGLETAGIGRIYDELDRDPAG